MQQEFVENCREHAAVSKQWKNLNEFIKIKYS